MSLTATKPLNCFVRPRVSRMKSSSALCGAAAIRSPPRELTVARALHLLEAHPGQRLDQRIELRWTPRGAVGRDREPIQVLIDDNVAEAGVVREVHGAILARIDHRPGAVTTERGGRADALRFDTAAITPVEQGAVARVGHVAPGGCRVVLTEDLELRQTVLDDCVVARRALGHLWLGHSVGHRAQPHAKLWHVDIARVGSKR